MHSGCSESEQKSMHNIKIEHDERFMARPFGILCKCGFRGAAADEQEAERIKEQHERAMEQQSS